MSDDLSRGTYAWVACIPKAALFVGWLRSTHLVIHQPYSLNTMNGDSRRVVSYKLRLEADETLQLSSRFVGLGPSFSLAVTIGTQTRWYDKAAS